MTASASTFREGLCAIEEEMHCAAHEVDAVAPAIRVTRVRRHAGLKCMAGKAAPDQNVLAPEQRITLRRREEFGALILRNVVPADHVVRSRKLYAIAPFASSLRPDFGSAANPGALTCRRYSPAENSGRR